MSPDQLSILQEECGSVDRGRTVANVPQLSRPLPLGVRASSPRRVTFVAMRRDVGLSAHSVVTCGPGLRTMRLEDRPWMRGKR